MAASHSGEVLSVSEAEGFNLRMKVYTDTSKSEKTANKRKSTRRDVSIPPYPTIITSFRAKNIRLKIIIGILRKSYAE